MLEKKNVSYCKCFAGNQSNQLNLVGSVGAGKRNLHCINSMCNGCTFVRHSGADQAPADDDSQGFP